jgi:hypothetical protein
MTQVWLAVRSACSPPACRSGMPSGPPAGPSGRPGGSASADHPQDHHYHRHEGGDPHHDPDPLRPHHRTTPLPPERPSAKSRQADWSAAAGPATARTERWRQVRPTAPDAGRARVGRHRTPADEGRRRGFLLDRIRVRLGQLDRPSPGQRARSTRQPAARAATPTSVHQQPFDRIGSGVQGGLDGGQPIEALPAPLIQEGDFQDHPPAVLLPGPVDRPLVRAASTSASPWASFQRAAEERPLNTSMDHHSMAATVVPPIPPH